MLSAFGPDERVSGDGLLSSGQKLLLSSSFSGVTGGSHSKLSFEEAKPEFLDVLTSTVWKLNMHTQTHSLLH